MAVERLAIRNGEIRPVTYLDRIVEPNRSLSRRGMLFVLIIAAAFNTATAAFMIAIGAYPAPLFLGLDMVAISAAFYILDRRWRRRQERVEITTDRVAIFRPPSAREPVWSAAPQFTRINLSDDPDLPILRLTSSGRSVILGSELGAEGRLQLKEDLDRALQSVRSERYQTFT